MTSLFNIMNMQDVNNFIRDNKIKKIRIAEFLEIEQSYLYNVLNGNTKPPAELERRIKGLLKLTSEQVAELNGRTRAIQLKKNKEKSDYMIKMFNEYKKLKTQVNKADSQELVKYSIKLG